MKTPVKICTCMHMVSMHSVPRKKNGETRPCFFSDCDCKDFVEQSRFVGSFETPTRVGDVIEVEPGYSPSSRRVEESGFADLCFGDAMTEVARGKTATRAEWGDPNIYVLMFRWGKQQCPNCNYVEKNVPTGNYLSLHHADGTMHPLFVNDGDMQGLDWQVL